MEKSELLIDILEDDADISRLMNLALKSQGYEIRTFDRPTAFLEDYAKKKPNILLLDLMLPEMKGEEVLRKIREEYHDDSLQILIVSAKTLLENKIEGLELGADDYISKPFEVLELISRVNSKARRILTSENIRFGDFTLIPGRRELFEKETPVRLTYTEFELLLFFATNKNKVITRDELFKKLWGNDACYESRVLDVHIKDLRKKLGDKDGKLIETVYGVGYRWNG